MRVLWLLAALLTAPLVAQAGADAPPRPNILLALADDWGWPHAGAYGDPVVRTPTFDALAADGALFAHAYVSSPSCTPSRGSLLTGKYHWQLGAGANLWCVFPDEHVTYAELLAQAGYHVGFTGKGWGPGRPQTKDRELAGRRYPSFAAFLAARPAGRPFCFWLGSSDPHRPYAKGSGAASGIDPAKIELPACFPDRDEVRSDVADYYFEVQRFDRLVGEALAALDASGEVERTIVVMTGDHGPPFPRGKGNLYDTGVRVPLALRWPECVQPGRRIDAFVSFVDLAPTFLEAAGVAVPEAMTGRRLQPLLRGEAVEGRDAVVFGKERHVPAQAKPDRGGYPCRAIRTREFLYVRNFRPDRWPAGTPDWQNATMPGAWYADCDDGPTKRLMILDRERDEEHRRAFALAFARRPAEELYDLRTDPEQLHDVAGEAAFAAIKASLRARLQSQLEATGDPRVRGEGDAFEAYPYLGGGGGKHPDWRPRRDK